ncbi:MAG: dTDP-4-dehydrorhamnose reductase [Bacilli bacterium]|nr:dTDP-4-dehydrorhamnose reductase [Bacilli bacterium]
MDNLEFEKGRAEDKCIDFKSNIIETNLADCYIIEENRFGDDRGYFTSVTSKQLDALDFKKWSQKSESMSAKGTIRGLHFQKDPYCQAKVVSCTKGAVLDVVVDMRKDSPTYGEYTAIELTPENGRMLYVPRGYAHGFLALTDDATFNYMVDNEYAPRLEGGVLWNDPVINIPWDEIFRKYDIEEPLLSDKDRDRIPLSESEVNFLRRPKKYLVTGVNGQLGYDIVKELKMRGEEDILGVDIDVLDITDREQVMKIVKAYKPDVIFHCAAWTAVDKAEELEDKCRKVNVEGTKNLVDASIEVGSKIVYMSTDYVFDGEKEGLYKEEDRVNPKSVYGQTKFEGEEEVRRNQNHFITRISWVFGENGNNFIKTMLKLADKYDELSVVGDQIGSPTYTVDLAKLLVEMAETEKFGTYHVNNEGYCSWAEFAKYIMESNGKDTVVNSVTTEEYYAGKDTSNIAYRPRNSKLDKSKLEKEFYKLPSWQDATDRYCKQLTKNKKWWLENLK